jgi:hypothetical protein
LRNTHTYVTLEISAAGYDEIARKLRAADYGHCFNSNGDIDMTGIAVVRGPDPNVVRRVPTFDGQEWCANCGGIHYGSIQCPYNSAEGAALKKAAVEKSQAEQAAVANEAKS